MDNLGDSMKKEMSKLHWNDKYNLLMKKVYTDSDVIEFCQKHKEELKEDALTRSSAKIYEYVTEREKVKNGKDTFASGYEPKLIVSNHLIDVAYVPTKQTIEKRSQEKMRQRVRSISMPKDIRKARLDEFENSGERDNAFDAINDFIDSYELSPKERHQALYLAGDFGVGKTYLLAAAANQLADDGFTSTLIHFPSFAVEMKNAIGQNNLSNKLETIKKSSILMIDDIGADSMSAWIRDDILGVILEYRMQQELPTFFSSNFPMSELEQHLAVSNRGDDEPLKAKRLMQRIRFLAKEITVGGRNWRPQ